MCRVLVCESTQQILSFNPVMGRYEDISEQGIQSRQLAEPPRVVGLTIPVALWRDLRGVLRDLREVESFGQTPVLAAYILAGRCCATDARSADF
jgi:hypothetical protein